MGCSHTSLILSNKVEVLWIDNSIDNGENKGYTSKLNGVENIKQLICVKNVNEGIEKLKIIEFKKTLIICSGRQYPDFLNEFKNSINQFMICPKVIIFTGNKQNYEKRNLNDKELHINHPFYNSGGVVDKFNDVLSFLKNNNVISIQNLLDNDNEIDNNNNILELNFEYVSTKRQLILPIHFYHY